MNGIISNKNTARYFHSQTIIPIVEIMLKGMLLKFCKIVFDMLIVEV